MLLGFIFMFMTLLVLILGLILMAFGGKINSKYSKKLMTARVFFQFLAVVSLFIFFITTKTS